MSVKQGKRYTPRFKFQVVMEVLKSSKPIGQIARAYSVHPITIHKWKKDFTKIVYRRGVAKAQLMPIIDHSSKLAARTCFR